MKCGWYNYCTHSSSRKIYQPLPVHFTVKDYLLLESEQLHTFPVDDQSFNHLGESDGSNISGDDVDDLVSKYIVYKHWWFTLISPTAWN